MRPILPFVFLTVFLWAVPMAAPLAATDNAPARTEVNAAIVDGHAVPRHIRLKEAAGELAGHVKALCTHPGADALATARDGWHAASDAWFGVQHMRFGPQELLMRSWRLHFWPDPDGRVREQVAEWLSNSDGAIPAPDVLASASVAIQGLPAAEVLLFGDGSEALGAPNGDPRRCDLLIAVARNVVAIATEMVDEWTVGNPSYGGRLRTPSTDDPVIDGPGAVTLLFVKGLHDTLQATADKRLAPALGPAIEKAQPRLAESPAEGRAVRDIVVMLEALDALYRGENGRGLAALARTAPDDPGLDALMTKAFAKTIGTARAIPVPLAQAVADPAVRPQIETLLTQVRALRQIVATRLADALGLTLGFNALDGD